MARRTFDDNQVSAMCARLVSFTNPLAAGSEAGNLSSAVHAVMKTYLKFV